MSVVTVFDTFGPYETVKPATFIVYLTPPHTSKSVVLVFEVFVMTLLRTALYEMLYFIIFSAFMYSGMSQDTRSRGPNELYVGAIAVALIFRGFEGAEDFENKENHVLIQKHWMGFYQLTRYIVSMSFLFELIDSIFCTPLKVIHGTLRVIRLVSYQTRLAFIRHQPKHFQLFNYTVLITLYRIKISNNSKREKKTTFYTGKSILTEVNVISTMQRKVDCIHCTLYALQKK